MKKIAIFIMINILSLSLYSCNKDNPTEDKDNLVDLIIPLGTYKYNGFDSTGVKIVTGWTKIIFDDSVNISGEWELDKIGDPQNIGPQVGSGTLRGTYDGNKIYCDLNPGYVDNNLILRGKYDDKKIEGDWMYVGFPGIINYGTFVAEKK